MNFVNSVTKGPRAKKSLSRFLPILFPFLRWFKGYSAASLRLDLISGLTVALVLIPQSMAYAQLANLPAYYGLYAAFLPPVIAAMWGSSNQLATGPVAIVSLMTSTALAPLATAGGANFIAYAILLALTVGLFQFLLGVFRLGMVVNFLSHPVVNGFTNAAAIIIATSQLSKLFGVDVDSAEHQYETVYRVIEAAFQHTHWPTLALGAFAFLIMIVLRKLNPRIPNVLIAVILTTLISWATGFEKNITVRLAVIRAPEVHSLVDQHNTTLKEIDGIMERRIELTRQLRETENRYGKHSVEAIELQSQLAKEDVLVEGLRERDGEFRSRLRSVRLVQLKDDSNAFVPLGAADASESGNRPGWKMRVGGRRLDTNAITLAGGGEVVGMIPRGLPRIAAPEVDFNVLLDLFPMAIVISLLGFMEAISIAKAMAARTGQRLDPNQELIGQGLANIVGSFALSYPVSGSFSRSAVNIQTGAVTGLSNVISSLMVAITLLFFTPLLYHLPQAVLAAIIMMAVIGLVNVSGFAHAWRAQWFDGAVSIITFLLTLWFAPHLDKGIIIGVLLSLGLYLLRNMKPQVAQLSRTPDGHYRSAERWNLALCSHVGVIRFNNSLIFANVNHLEDKLLELFSRSHQLKHLIIVGNGMNELDASGEVYLSKLVTQLRQQGMDISFSGLNDHVIDVMKRTHLYEKIGESHFFLSIAQAVETIHHGTCIVDHTFTCPLLAPGFKPFEVSIETSELAWRASHWMKTGGEQESGGLQKPPPERGE